MLVRERLKWMLHTRTTKIGITTNCRNVKIHSSSNEVHQLNAYNRWQLRVIEREHLPCDRTVIPCFFCLTHKTITAASVREWHDSFLRIKFNKSLTKFATKNFILFSFCSFSANYSQQKMPTDSTHNCPQPRF